MNPFIELFKHPVESLAWLSYTLIILGFLGITWWALYRNAFTIYVQYKKRRWTYDPPPGFILRVVAIPFVLGIDAALLSAFIYLTT